MLNEKVNLTRLCILREIQSVLLESEYYQSNSLLHNPDSQRQIIDYILSKLSNRYMVLENITEIPRMASSIFPECPIYEHRLIQKLLEAKISDMTHFSWEKSKQLKLSNRLLPLEESR